MTLTTPRPTPHSGRDVSPKPAPDERYAAAYAHHRLHVFPDDRAAVASALALPKARTVAEIGCGPGFYALAFAVAYPHLQVTGIDRAPAQLAIARDRAARQGAANVRFVAGDVGVLGRWRGAFDRVVASRLLMVVPERAHALAEMRRVLAPGGLLLLAEPVAPPPASLVAAFRAHAGGNEPPAPHLFTAASFAALVAGQMWAAATLWEAHGYRYALCRTDDNETMNHTEGGKWWHAPM